MSQYNKKIINTMKQEIKLSGGLSITLDDNQKKELLEQLNETNKKELVKKEILDILEKYKSNVRFLDSNHIGLVSKYPSSRFDILDENGDWLFDIDYDTENKHFWYSYYGIYKVFHIKYSITCDDIKELIKNILEDHLNLKDVTPVCSRRYTNHSFHWKFT